MVKNKYLISLIFFHLFLFYSCKEESNHSNLKEKEVLLSKLSIPKDYNVIVKDHYYPEGEISRKNDSLYVLKRGKTKIEISVKYFLDEGFSKAPKDNIENRMNLFTEGLFIDNKSFKLLAKKINKQESIWYVKYTFGSRDDLLYNFYMERETGNYKIKIKTYDNNLSLDDIEFFYNELCKFKD
jgi:hypothetical protein